MLQLAKILLYISWFSVLIPIFFLFKRKQNFREAPIKFLGILLFASLFSDSLSYVVIKMGESNLPVTNIAILIDFFLINYIYFLLLKNKKIFYVVLVFFIIFFIINTIFIQSIHEFQSWSRLAEAIIVIVYAVSYYWQMLKSKPLIDFVIFYRFWLNSALFLYFAFNLYIFALSNYIFKNMEAEVGIITWGFHNINNIGKNIIFALAIYCVKMKGRIYDLST